MAWATPDDVIDAWVGPDAAPDDRDQLALWIGRAERRIRAAVPDIQSRIDAGEPDLLENAVDVAVAMVTRVYRNPSGHRSISGQETTGQFSGSNTITFGGNNPGALELLDDERDLLSGSSGDAGAFEVDMMLGSPGPSMVPRMGVWL